VRRDVHDLPDEIEPSEASVTTHVVDVADTKGVRETVDEILDEQGCIDILANVAGMTTVLVLTGVTDREDVATSPVQPDYIIDGLGDIGDILDTL